MNIISSLRTVVVALACCVAASAWADPSARVGRIAAIEGAVEFRSTFESDPAQASVNWPLTAGNMVATGPRARTELRVGSSVVRVGPQSELEITALDDARFNVSLLGGSATVRVRNAEVAREFRLQTPEGGIVLLQPARLRIDALRDDRGMPYTSVHVIDGVVRFDPADGGQAGIVLQAGSRLESSQGASRIVTLRAPQVADGFDSWSLARDGDDDRSTSARYVSTETTGYEELDRNGVWRVTEEYGPVWTPTVVVAGWAPYRSGRWIWVAPWGWTWVDSAPWGYAPSHYGRWVTIDNRWCWTPGAPVARPVWAPALVGWRDGRGWNVAVSASSPPTSGWFPLAPREVYVPPYSVSRTYVQRVNVTQVNNVTQINQFYDGRHGGRWAENYRYRDLPQAPLRPMPQAQPAQSLQPMQPVRQPQAVVGVTSPTWRDGVIRQQALPAAGAAATATIAPQVTGPQGRQQPQLQRQPDQPRWSEPSRQQPPPQRQPLPMVSPRSEPVVEQRIAVPPPAVQHEHDHAMRNREDLARRPGFERQQGAPRPPEPVRTAPPPPPAPPAFAAPVAQPAAQAPVVQPERRYQPERREQAEERRPHEQREGREPREAREPREPREFRRDGPPLR